ncbi:MAG: hypothetical protein VX836_07120 [Pseudomonadota bacterium]|jgi:hypothetical protein|nr:hypothetical protein [Pseudomonadota bacterium]
MRLFSSAWPVISTAVCLSLSACGPTVQSFVMPDFETVRYEELKHPARLVPVHVEANYESNGKSDEGSSRQLKADVENVLRHSKVMLPTTDPAVKASIAVTAENSYDPKQARAAGIKAGISMGYNGQQVIDRYKFTVVYRDESGEDRLGRYDHEFHTAIGKVTPPERAALVEPGSAFYTVVQDVILKFLYDLQAVDNVDVPIMFVPDSDKKL